MTSSNTISLESTPKDKVVEMKTAATKTTFALNTNSVVTDGTDDYIVIKWP